MWLTAVLVAVTAVGSQETSLLTLTDGNFETYKSRFASFLVHIHAPVCSICRNMTMTLQKISDEYRGMYPSFRVGLVDAVTERNTAAKLSVTSFPTLVLLHNNQTKVYKGAIGGVSGWLKNRLKPAVGVFNTSTELAEFVRLNTFTTVLFAESGSEYVNLLQEIAEENPDLPIAIATTTDTYDLWKASVPSLIVSNIADNIRFTYTGPWSKASISTYILRKSVRVKLPWIDSASEYIFDKGQPALIFSRAEATALTYSKTLEPLWRLGRIPFIELDFTSYKQYDLLDFLGIGRIRAPNVMIVQVTEGQVKKYAMQGEVNLTTVTAFLDSWENGLLEPFYKSDSTLKPLPDNLISSIIELNAENYQEIVSKPGLHVLIWIYVPGCRNQTDFTRSVGEVKKRNDVLIGEINGSSNDVPGIHVDVFPQLYLYPAHTKTPVRYQGDFKSTDILEFVSTTIRERERRE